MSLEGEGSHRGDTGEGHEAAEAEVTGMRLPAPGRPRAARSRRARGPEAAEARACPHLDRGLRAGRRAWEGLEVSAESPPPVRGFPSCRGLAGGEAPPPGVGGGYGQGSRESGLARVGFPRGTVRRRKHSRVAGTEACEGRVRARELIRRASRPCFLFSLVTVQNANARYHLCCLVLAHTCQTVIGDVK